MSRSFAARYHGKGDRVTTPNPFAWHRKPIGFNGSPCPICGATADRLRAEHRALPFPENVIGGYVKRVKVCFGLDSMTEVIK